MTPLICNRLATMKYKHPDQIVDRCADCGEEVGIFPSGQRVLEQVAGVKIVCDACYVANYPGIYGVEAPGAIDEARELWKKAKQ